MKTHKKANSLRKIRSEIDMLKIRKYHLYDGAF